MSTDVTKSEFPGSLIIPHTQTMRRGCAADQHFVTKCVVYTATLDACNRVPVLKVPRNVPLIDGPSKMTAASIRGQFESKSHSFQTENPYYLAIDARALLPTNRAPPRRCKWFVGTKQSHKPHVRAVRLLCAVELGCWLVVGGLYDRL